MAYSIRTPFMSNDVDWYKFTIDNPFYIVVETSSEEGDTEMYLHNSTLSRISEDDEGGEGSFSKIETSLDPGNYYINITSFDMDETILSYNILLTVYSGIE